jgi:Primase C terminal 2 (PriCT-2)
MRNPQPVHKQTNGGGADRAAEVTPLVKFCVTQFPDRFAQSFLSVGEMSLEELQRLVQNTSADHKSKLPFLKLAKFGDQRSDANCLRCNANVKTINGVETDYDEGKISFEEAVATVERAGLTALLYTSASHTTAAPRWRIVMPTSKDLPPSERVKLVARINGLFGGSLAPESFVLSQSYYFGSVNNNPEHRAVSVRGDYIDLRDDLDANARGKANGQAFDDAEHVPNAPEADIGIVAAALAVIPNDNGWETWNRIGMATWRATGGNAEGFAAFDTWSRKSKKYDAADTAAKWAAYFRSPPTQIGAGTIIHLADEADPGWRNRYDTKLEAELRAANARAIAELGR